MDNQNFKAYAAWLKTLSDCALNSLWLKYCAPTENPNAKLDTDKAYLIDNEKTERELP